MISGPEFRLKRAAEGFSGREVARGSGINHSHENLWERGRLILRDDQIERLTRCLRIRQGPASSAATGATAAHPHRGSFVNSSAARHIAGRAAHGGDATSHRSQRPFVKGEHERNSL